MLLIKVSPKQEYVNQFLAGKLFSQRLEKFRQMENDQQRGDSYEGTMVYPPGSILTLQSTNLLTKETNEWKTPLDDLADNITLQLTALKYLNVFCMYAVDFNDFKEIPNNNTKRTLDLPDSLWKFGDYAAIVFNVPEFISRVRRAARSLHYGFWSDRVAYYCTALGLPNNTLNASLVFLKRNQFAHQKEYRLVFDSHSVGNYPITINVGDIGDIAVPIWKNNLNQEFNVEFT